LYWHVPKIWFFTFKIAIWRIRLVKIFARQKV
jgi:hypothetical protein